MLFFSFKSKCEADQFGRIVCLDTYSKQITLASSSTLIVTDLYVSLRPTTLTHWVFIFFLHRRVFGENKNQSTLFNRSRWLTPIALISKQSDNNSITRSFFSLHSNIQMIDEKWRGIEQIALFEDVSLFDEIVDFSVQIYENLFKSAIKQMTNSFFSSSLKQASEIFLISLSFERYTVIITDHFF